MNSNRRIYFSKNNNPFFNLATEEYFARTIRNDDIEILFIYINTPCVVLGKNQNLYNEVNINVRNSGTLDFCRRISGGGTVVHDLGNINFAFIKPKNSKNINNYSDSTGFLVNALNDINIPAILNCRNAIEINNLKIGGSAQFVCSNSILTHFTVLFNSDLKFIDEAIKKNSYLLSSKSTKSVRSKITNLKEYCKFSQEEFIDFVMQKWNAKDLIIENTHFKKIEELEANQYRAVEWICDKASDSTIENNNLSLTIKNGFIVEISFKNLSISTSEYIGKRLLKKEIEEDDILWKLLQ